MYKKDEGLKELSAISKPKTSENLEAIGSILSVIYGIGVIVFIFLAIQAADSRYSDAFTGIYIGLAIGSGIAAWINYEVFNALAAIVESTYKTAQATQIQAKYLISNVEESNTENLPVMDDSLPTL